MNICFLMGKILSNINFDFIINDKNNIYIATFEIGLSNKSKIIVKGYNKIADYCYRYLNENNNIFIYGSLNLQGEVEIIRIYF